MEESGVKITGSGISFTTILFFIFLTLKLCGIIDWSWWLVTAPLWFIFVPLLIVFIGWLILFIVGLFVAWFKK